MDLSFARVFVIVANILTFCPKTLPTDLAASLLINGLLSDSRFKISALDNFLFLNGKFSDTIISSKSLIHALVEVMLLSCKSFSSFLFS